MSANVKPKTDEEREQVMDDLARLEQALNNNELEYTERFFLGGEEIYPEDVKCTRKFIADVRAAIGNGLTVFYDSWW